MPSLNKQLQNVDGMERREPRIIGYLVFYSVTWAILTMTLHCEKSLFVLASHQKIPVWGTENPAVDTRTICLLPIEFF